MDSRELYSIEDARKLLGGIARNTIYELLRNGSLSSVEIGRRRFVSATAIAEFIAGATRTGIDLKSATRRRAPDQLSLLLGPRRRVRAPYSGAAVTR
jgi:excisionase family DNA binding protein